MAEKINTEQFAMGGLAETVVRREPWEVAERLSVTISRAATILISAARGFP
jgi:hypothetical protein